jgi:hypothetical protein
MGKAMMYIASVFAQFERETIAERVRDNISQNVVMFSAWRKQIEMKIKKF